MAITYDSDHQDQIAYLLARMAYSNLQTAQKDAIDNTATGGSAGGAVKRALDRLGYYANAYAVDDISTIPDNWEPWFIAEAALEACPAFPDANTTELRRNAAGARRDALVAYVRQTFDSTADGDIGAFTIASIRADVAVNALRQQRKSIFLEPAMIDSVIEEVVAEIWNGADWAFKRKLVTLTIATNGTVTASGSVSVDKIIGDRIQYDQSFGGDCLSVDYETILGYRAAVTDSGKPGYFHLLRGPDDLVWIFDRTPDQEYTAKAYVTAQTPTMSSQDTMNTGLSLFPVDFRPVIRDRVLATCLNRVGVRTNLYEDTQSKMEYLLARYDNPGGELEQSEVHGWGLQGLGWHPGHIGGSGV